MKKRIPIVLGLMLMCLAGWLLITQNVTVRNFINDVENIGYDAQIKARVLTHPQKVDTPIAIIDIDNNSILSEGRWPWSRKKMSLLVQKLHDLGASVIAFDIFFSEAEKNINEELTRVLDEKQQLTPELKSVLIANATLFDDDLNFSNSLKLVPSILAISFLPDKLTVNTLPAPIAKLTTTQNSEINIIRGNGYLSNIHVLQDAAANAGFINTYPDADGVLRRTPLVMAYKDGVYASLALRAVMNFLGLDVEIVTPVYHDHLVLEGIKLGSKMINTNIRGQVLIPFIGKSYTFPYYSATDILHDKIPPDTLLGKIVFVGTSATGLGDLQATAIESPFPGVEVQASVAHGLLKGGFSYRPAWTLGANLFLVIFFGTLTAFIFPYLGPRTLAGIIVFLPVILMFLNVELWVRTGLVFSLLMPVLLILVNAVMNMLYGYLFETRKREQLKDMFGQYVPEKHIDEMLKSGSGFTMHGEDREMSVLFADIRSFTTLSEKMTAKELVEMLNTFFTPMTEIIFKNKGTIDKYVGDLIMAFWGAPLKDKQHARHALKSAISMQLKVKEMQDELKQHGWPEIHIGIGVNSGIMSVGDMGSLYRRNYTVLGDNVNLASRVEGLSKFYGVDIVTTENTLAHQKDFVFRLLDKVKVKGKENGVAIYEVLGDLSILTPELQQSLSEYHQALDLYFAEQWDEASSILERLHKKDPDKKLYSLYLERTRDYKANPPAKPWDGIYTHTNK